MRKESLLEKVLQEKSEGRHLPREELGIFAEVRSRVFYSSPRFVATHPQHFETLDRELEFPLSEVLPSHGDEGDIPWSSICPAGYIVSGIRGLREWVYTELTFRCSRLVLSGDDRTGFSLSFGDVVELDTVGSSGIGDAVSAACSSGQVAYGVTGRAGMLIDEIGFYCTTPSLELD